MAVVWPDDDLDQARSYLVEGRLGDFFRESLGWDESDLGDSSFQTVKVDDPLVPSGVLNVECVAMQSGIPVWVCRVDRIPSNTSQLEVDRTLRALSMHRLCIFVQEGVGFTPRQVWRWPSASSSRLTRHELLVTDEAQIEALLERCVLLYLTSDDIANGVSPLALLDRMRRGFDIETFNETRDASNQMADLFESLAKAGMSDDKQISTVMARLLFLLFADDTQMWSETEDSNSFERMIRGTHQEGTDLAQRLNELFDLLNKKPSGASAVADAPEYLSGFKYVNGGMFADAVPLPAEMSGAVAKTFRQQLLATSERDWSKVSPAIFGSMFQSVRDAKTRREMGEHYTSEEDVLKTLNPLFLDELHDEFEKAIKQKDTGKRRTALNNLRRRIANIRFMDPACGCGNFIIIAYREMRKLELDILVRLRDLGVLEDSELSSLVVGKAGVSEDVRKRARSIEPLVTIDNFYGLELDPWPASIARTAMFLVERQMDQKMMEEFGYAPVRLPLAHSAHILEGDALTEVDPASDEYVDRDWSKVLPVTAQDVADGVRVYIAGNPPFSGQGKRGNKEEEKEAKKRAMMLVWGKDYAGYLDFVTAWFAKAARYLKTLQEQSETLGVTEVPGEFAFVSTNSIVQGKPVPSLFGPLFRDGWRLKFAYRTFPWQSEAAGKAAVHCVITGFTRSEVPEKRSVRVFDYDWSTRRTVEQESAHSLNAYLVSDGPNVLVKDRSKPLSSNLSQVRRGNQPSDNRNLIVEVEDYPVVAADPVAARYLRPYRMGKELVQGLDRWCLWLVDATEGEIASSPVLSERVQKVAERRARSSKPQTRQKAATPHLFDEIRQPVEPYLGIPRVVSELRPYYTVAVMLPPNVIAGDKLYTAIDRDGFLFALFSSSMFITWQRAIGGRLESRLSFSNEVVWNNLPLPQISEEQRRKVIAAGRKVLAAREAIEERAGEPVSLAEMYASLATMDPALRAAHDELDSAVDVAFGATRRCSSEAKRLEILFERYQELTAAEEAAKPAKKPRARRRTAK